MLFNSSPFILFFIAVTTLYYLLPWRWRWPLLLAASCGFYMAFIPVYILILATTIVVDYVAGIYIERTTGATRKLWLIGSISCTVLILFVFKYFNFVNDNVAALARLLHWNYGIDRLRLILPIGLSFHTFQSMSYVIEVYRRRQVAERHFGIYALYVMFYPQLVAGPIERPQNLLPQFRQEHRFDYANVTDGLKLMAWGFFKKLVIADRAALMVNQIYGDPEKFTGVPLIVATVLFAFQIYCDFSGYSDIAIGSAQVMGFRLMKNFDRPYASRSIGEFWRRWHISLSTWFKDYLYISLGGSRTTVPRWYRNLFVTFLISGIWHGANWTFVVFGFVHGCLFVMSVIKRRNSKKKATPQLLNMVATFILLMLTFAIFRADNLLQAFGYYRRLFSTSIFSPFVINEKVNAVAMLTAIILMFWIEWLQRDKQHALQIDNISKFPARALIYIGLIFFILTFSPVKITDFIYFKF
jgi:alginate O-acetyltransferase complex protein AlgI